MDYTEINRELSQWIEKATNAMNRGNLEEALEHADKGYEFIMERLEQEPENQGLNCRRIEIQKLQARLRLDIATKRKDNHRDTENTEKKSEKQA